MFGITLSDRQKGILVNAGIGMVVAVLGALQGSDFTQAAILGAIVLGGAVFFTTLQTENFATGAKVGSKPARKAIKVGI
jgi:hypothetical protein